MKTLLPLIAIALAGCSTSPTPRNTPVSENKNVQTVEAKYAASELGAQEVAEIRFPRGSTELKGSELRKINTAIAKAQSTGKIEEIKVIAWADREFPSFNDGSLPRSDQTLADHRSDALQNLLSSKVKDVDIDKYNMAVYPNGVDRLFKTSDFRVKRSLEQAGIPNTDSGVKAPPMSGKALVMILLEKKSEPASN